MMPYFWQLTIKPKLKTQNSRISFRYVDSQAKICLILYPPIENSTTRIAIIVIYMKEAINAPIVESPLSNQDKIPLLLWVCAQWFRVSLACLPSYRTEELLQSLSQ